MDEDKQAKARIFWCNFETIYQGSIYSRLDLFYSVKLLITHILIKKEHQDIRLIGKDYLTKLTTVLFEGSEQSNAIVVDGEYVNDISRLVGSESTIELFNRLQTRI